MKFKYYTFRDKESELDHIIFARNAETAQKIIDIANELSMFHYELIENYVRVMELPYKSYDEIEQDQLNTELKNLKYRKEKLN